MADRYYAVSALGNNLAAAVTEGVRATGAAFVDLRVTYDASGSTKTEVVRALEAIKDYIIHVDNWPPV